MWMNKDFSDAPSQQTQPWVERASQIVDGTKRGFRNHWIVLHSIIVSILNRAGLRTDGAERTKEKELKVVVVGYSRTGTHSLKLALEKLGFPTLHTQHLWEYEYREIMDMWMKEVFHPSMEANQIIMGRPDFAIIANKFQATSDLPYALYYEQIMEDYPNCKYILTEREDSETWFRSWDMLTKTITPTTLALGTVYSGLKKMSTYLRWLYAYVDQDMSFLTAPAPLPPQNKEAAIQSYEAHNRRVRETIPAQQLLEYNVKQGWSPLCEFLDISDCPFETPFPKSNTACETTSQVLASWMVYPLLLLIGFATAAKVKLMLRARALAQQPSLKMKNL